MNTWNLLGKIVARTKCKLGWSFRLETKPENLMPSLVIRVLGVDSSEPDRLAPMAVDHSFPVPEATYNAATWRRWIFECCRGVENHELGEWLRFDRDEQPTLRPFLPLHGPGEDPYTVHEFRPITDALTTQDGSLRKP